MDRAALAAEYKAIADSMRGEAQNVMTEAEFAAKKWPDHPFPINSKAAAKKMRLLIEQLDNLIGLHVRQDT